MQIRPATPDDYDAYTRLFGELGVDDPLPPRERFCAEIVARMVVAVDGGAVVGYALTDAFASAGKVANLVTAPSHRRRGVGRALMDETRARFRAAGATEWCLNVKPENTAAIALYEACGLRAAYRSCALRLPHAVVLPEPPADARLAPLAADEDARVEPAFRLLQGQLAAGRARPSRQVLALTIGADPIAGVGVFLDTIPGAFPFRMRDPAGAAAFLALLRPLCPPASAFVQVGVEDDEPLRAAILALGAHSHLEIQHMRGAL